MTTIQFPRMWYARIQNAYDKMGINACVHQLGMQVVKYFTNCTPEGYEWVYNYTRGLLPDNKVFFYSYKELMYETLSGEFAMDAAVMSGDLEETILMINTDVIDAEPTAMNRGCIAHECTHLEQIMSGRLKMLLNGNTWDGKFIPAIIEKDVATSLERQLIEYPWEIEAYKVSFSFIGNPHYIKSPNSRMMRAFCDFWDKHCA